MKKAILLAAIAVVLVALGLNSGQEWVASASALLSKQSGPQPGQPKPYNGDLPSMARINIRNAVLEKVYSGLDHPWAMEILSDEELLISEFGGGMVRLNLLSGKASTVTGLPDYLATGKDQIGLMDIALHPQFSDNKLVYFSHALESPTEPGKHATALSRATLDGQQLDEVRQIFVATPYGKSPSNFGGALAFDDLGYLYLGTGDRSREQLAQEPNRLTGKILRLTDTAKVPVDNPFVQDPLVDDSIYALGVRNPQGLVFDHESGQLLEIYRGGMFPEWEGDLLVGALKGAHISKLDRRDGAIISEQPILDELEDRIRDIKVASDGSILILTQKEGAVYRLYRDFKREDLDQGTPRKGKLVYRIACATCHSAQSPGVPQLGDTQAWKPRARKGLDQLYQNTLHGVGDMPPRGLCGNCSEVELRKAVDFMLDKAKLKADSKKDTQLATATAAKQIKPLLKQQRSEKNQRPNFVVFIADDLGWDDIGPYGNRFVQTPHIDQLAAGGLRFDNAFLTTSSCSPSRASILTGKYPNSNGLMHLHQAMPASEKTIAALLGNAGYYTAAFGKWHIGAEIKAQFSKVAEDKRGSGAGRWVKGLRERPRNKPFFFWLASRDPHRPWLTDGDPAGPNYDPASISLPPGFVDGPGGRAELAAYFSEVSRFDRDIGKVVAELKAQGVLENTVIIVMSDNGRPFFGAKQLLYDAGIKTPFILHWPAQIAAADSRAQLISMVDLAPTVLEWAGLAAPQYMQGVSFAGMIADPAHRSRDYIFAQRNWHGRNAHERLVRSLHWAYKENRFPLHGDCINGGYGFSAAFREFQQAYSDGKLTDTEAACFATVRPDAELLAVDANGVEVLDNRIDEPQLQDVVRTMSRVLAQWRLDTDDRNYEPYTAGSADAAD